MKKYVLAGFVLLSFLLYSLHGRHDGQKVTLTPNSKQSSTPASQTPSSSGNGGTGMGHSGSMMASYRDGTYTGSMADAFYGYVQVRAIISGGKITDVVFLQHPSDRSESEFINSQAMPMLKQEALQAQSASVDGVSGATDTSQAFVQSLETALQKAQNA